jgi:ATP-dependent Clp protease ATP-binding subunit ClpA
MITPSLEAALNQAFDEANKRHHEYVTLEHLLYTLLSDPDAVLALKACRVDLHDLKESLESFFDKDLSTKIGDGKAEPTVGLNRTIQRAVIHAQGSSRQEVTGADILAHIFAEKDSYALFLLESQDATKLDLLNYISHGITKDGEDEILIPLEDDGQMGGDANSPAPQKSNLDQFTIHLNERARKGKIDPLIGRASELERLMQVLCRRKKNNPVIVGEAGVGKTAIVEGLAEMIENGDVPELLEKSQIYSLDLGALLAGTKFRGDFEARLKGVLSELQKIPKSILFIDEIHTIIGAGATEGAMDASNMLKPLLSSGDLRCIGSTTYQEYRQIFSKNAALQRRFQKIDVVEPSVADAIKILTGLKEHFEKHHGVKYSASAIQAAVELSQKYLHDRFLPDKAIDVIDEAGSANRLLPKSKQKQLLNDKDIENIIAKQTQIPVKTVTLDSREKLKNLERDLKILIFGQDEAISRVCCAIKLAKSGLTKGEKPIGAFLFAGPTGVGKTELTKQLAKSLGINFQRYDMSEYMEKHSVSRLIGAPPGYVGFDQGGLLTEAVGKHPHSVILMDEIEKAHPDLMNILLQVFDYGFLTDNNGKKADFRNAIVIMTTNAGAFEQSQNAIGFTPGFRKGAAMEAIRRMFAPEFINRLDAVVQFRDLDRPEIGQVVDKFLIELEQLLGEKSVTIAVSPEARVWIAENGYDPKYGARPIARLIQDKVKQPLVEELLFGKLVKGGHVKLTAIDGALSFDIKSVEKPDAEKSTAKVVKKARAHSRKKN